MPNIVNIHSVDSAVHDLAEHARHDEVRSWCHHNLRKFFLRDDRFCVSCPDGRTFGLYYSLHGMSEPPQWAKRLLRRGGTFDIFIFTIEGMPNWYRAIGQAIDYLNHLVDLRAGYDLSRWAVQRTLEVSERWHAEMALKAVDHDDLEEDEIVVVKEFADSVRIVSLHSARALADEGRRMGHCVGSYWTTVRNGHTQIYSLRDLKNRPHATIEVRDNVALQVKGKQNRIPIAKYASYVTAFIEERNFDFRHDGRRLGLVRCFGRTFGTCEGFFDCLTETADQVASLGPDELREIVMFISMTSKNPARDFTHRFLPHLVEHSPLDFEFRPRRHYQIGSTTVMAYDVRLRAALWYFSNPQNGFGPMLTETPIWLRNVARKTLQGFLEKVAARPLDIYHVDRSEMEGLIRLADAKEIYDDFISRTLQMKRKKWFSMISDLKAFAQKHRLGLPEDVKNFTRVAIPRHETDVSAGTAL